jgi:hypothetical protein
MADEQQQPEQPKIDTVRFYAAILTPEGSYTVQDFETLEELQTRIADLVDKDVTVFSFAGVQLKVSKPPFRHLLTPWGAKPLFTVPTENFEEDTTGYLGLDPVHFEAPPQVRVPTAKQSSAAGDEFFSDDGDNVTNIFDTILPDPDN